MNDPDIIEWLDSAEGQKWQNENHTQKIGNGMSPEGSSYRYWFADEKEQTTIWTEVMDWHWIGEDSVIICEFGHRNFVEVFPLDPTETHP